MSGKRRTPSASASSSTTSATTTASTTEGPPQKKQKTHHRCLAFFITCNPNKKQECPAVKPPPFHEEDLYFLGHSKHLGAKKKKEHWHAIVQFRTKKTYAEVKEWYGCHWIKLQTLKCYSKAVEYLNDDHCETLVPFESFGSYTDGSFRTDIEFAVHCAKKGRTKAYARKKRHSLYRIPAALDQIWKDYAPRPDFQIHLRHDWQLELIAVIDAELSKPLDDLPSMDWRTIHYVFNASGNCGKTEFAKYCQKEYETFVCRPAKTADILFSYQGQRVAILDIPKSVDDVFVAWNAMEQIKDGVWYSAKFKSDCLFRASSCVVIVFSNSPPPETRYSDDRIKLITI